MNKKNTKKVTGPNIKRYSLTKYEALIVSELYSSYKTARYMMQGVESLIQDKQREVAKRLGVYATDPKIKRNIQFDFEKNELLVIDTPNIDFSKLKK